MRLAASCTTLVLRACILCHLRKYMQPLFTGTNTGSSLHFPAIAYLCLLQRSQRISPVWLRIMRCSNNQTAHDYKGFVSRAVLQLLRLTPWEYHEVL